MTDQKSQSRSPAKTDRMTWVLLGITACVVALTIYVATHRPTGPIEPPDQTVVKASEADQVLALYGRNMETARRLSPAQAVALYQASRDFMEPYVRLHPDDVQVRPRLAELLLKMNAPAAAQQVVEDLLTLRPQSAEGLWLKGMCMRVQGQAGYERFLQQAAESPDAGASVWGRYGLDLMERRKYDDAEAWLTRAYQAGAKDAATLGALAQYAVKQERFEDAEKLLVQAVRDEAAAPDTWLLLARVQKVNGKLDDAATSVREAMRLLPAAASSSYLGPDKGEMLLVLGQVRVLQKRSQEAADAFVEAANYPFAKPLATFQAAQCWYLLGKYALALECIDSAEKLIPGDRTVAEWKKRIEDAHFLRVTPTTTSAMAAP
jgi:tetratricopeptide (TPR) repeat protein